MLGNAAISENLNNIGILTFSINSDWEMSKGGGLWTISFMEYYPLIGSEGRHGVKCCPLIGGEDKPFK